MIISLAGIEYAAFAAGFFTVYGLLSRVLAVRSENPIAFSAVYGLFGAAFSLPIVFMRGGSFNQMTGIVLVATFLATVFYGVQEATQFFMRKHLEASRSTIFYQLTPLVTFITSLWFLHESVTGLKVLGISLIVLGNIIAVYRHGGHITRPGLIYALISVVALGLAYVADKFASPNYPSGVYMFISYLFPALYVIPFIGSERLVSMRRELLVASWKLPLLSLVSVFGYYFVLQTFSVAEASVAIPIIFTSTIFTALGGIILLGERSSIVQKLAGAVFVFAGVILLRGF